MVNSALLLASEGFLDWLQNVDRAALLAVNGSDSLFLDSVVHVLTTAITWLPLYLSLFYLVVKNHNSLQRIGLIVGCAGLCILFAGAVDDLIVKPLVGRWRPTHDPVIGTLVDVVNGYRGGKYGFFSAHACNTFSIAIFFCWLVRSWALSFTLIIWSLTNCWTRLYLGVHFPGDIPSAPPSISSIVASRAIGGQKADVTSQPNILLAALSVPPARFLSRCSTLRSFSPS